MKKVYSISEARDFFLSHSHGSIVCCCRSCDASYVAECFPDAEKFYYSETHSREVK